MKLKNAVGIFFLIASIAVFAVFLALGFGTHKIRFVEEMTVILIMGIFLSGIFMDVPYLINIIFGILAEACTVVYAGILLVTKYSWNAGYFILAAILAAAILPIWYLVLQYFYYGDNVKAVFLTTYLTALAALCWYVISKEYTAVSWLYFILTAAVYATGLCSEKHGILSASYVITGLLFLLYFLGMLPLIFTFIISAVVFAALLMVDGIWGENIRGLCNKIRKKI